MAVKDKGAGALVPPKEKGEEDFPGHIQNNATTESTVSARQRLTPLSLGKLCPRPHDPNPQTLLPSDPAPAKSPSWPPFPSASGAPRPQAPSPSRSPTSGRPVAGLPGSSPRPPPLTSPQRLVAGGIRSVPWRPCSLHPLFGRGSEPALAPPLPPSLGRPWLTVSASPGPHLPNTNKCGAAPAAPPGRRHRLHAESRDQLPPRPFLPLTPPFSSLLPSPPFPPHALFPPPLPPAPPRGHPTRRPGLSVMAARGHPLRPASRLPRAGRGRGQTLRNASSPPSGQSEAARPGASARLRGGDSGALEAPSSRPRVLVVAGCQPRRLVWLWPRAVLKEKWNLREPGSEGCGS